MSAPLLSLVKISKSFGPVQVLNSITFAADSGEIIALVGENGAGKSTLMKIISGVWPHGSFSGHIQISGQEALFFSTNDAQKTGISIIHQELNLIPELSIAENIFLGREPQRWGIIDWGKLFEKTQDLLDGLQVSLSPKTPVKNLSIGQKQMVEIAKALSFKAKILILDEPTSALTENETKKLFRILQKLKRDGVLCIYISHKLSEVLEISDSIYVLRDGKLISRYPACQAQMERIISDMVGREIFEVFPVKNSPIGKIALEVKNLNCVDRNGNAVLRNISFAVQEGEILGIAGLMGSGRSELVNTIFGATSFTKTGEISVFGQKFVPRSPRYAIEAGLALLTEDRKLSGMIPERTVKDNMTLASIKQFARKRIIHDSLEKSIVNRLISQFKIKTQSQETEMRCLSGGNQQKVLLARWFLTKPKIVFLDEPTRGVDVGAKTEIYQLINQLADQGTAIVLISSDLPEVLKMSDRVVVLNRGCLRDILDKNSVTREKIMRLATC